MATYNGERYLKEQLNSIRMQTLPPDEVIICDDGSSDASVELIQDYIDKYQLSDRWRIVVNEENLGYIENFCKAISLTSGNYIFLSDQDDIFYPSKFEKICEFMDNHLDCYLVNAGFESIDENGNRLKNMRNTIRFKYKKSRKLTFKSWLYKSSFPGFSMCFRKEIRKRLVKTNRTHCYGHDQLLGLLALDWDGNYEIKEILSGYRIHDSNTTGGRKLIEDYRIDTRINQKKREYREYLLMEKMIQENGLSLDWKKELKKRKKDIKVRVRCMQQGNIIPLLNMILFSKNYPARTILGDILYLMKNKNRTISDS